MSSSQFALSWRPDISSCVDRLADRSITAADIHNGIGGEFAARDDGYAVYLFSGSNSAFRFPSSVVVTLTCQDVFIVSIQYSTASQTTSKQQRFCRREESHQVIRNNKREKKIKGNKQPLAQESSQFTHSVSPSLTRSCPSCALLTVCSPAGVTSSQVRKFENEKPPSQPARARDTKRQSHPALVSSQGLRGDKMGLPMRLFLPSMTPGR